MIHDFKTVRAQTPAIISSTQPSNYLGRKTSVVRFAQTIVSNRPENPHNMDKANDLNEKNGDVMSNSFGEGYATRSDEEGFGGVYGGNQSLPKVDIDKKIHENHPAYDKTQGSEVKEKEKGRHQTQANN